MQLEGNFLKGESFREHSDTDVKNFQAKVQWLLSDTQELQAFIQRYEADTQMPGALSPEDYQQDREQSKRQYDEYQGESTRWSVKYIHDLAFADSAELELLTFGHQSERFSSGALIVLVGTGLIPLCRPLIFVPHLANLLCMVSSRN